MLTITDNEGQKFIKTAFGWLKESTAHWLKDSGVFNCQTEAFIADNVGRQKDVEVKLENGSTRTQSRKFQGWICLKANALQDAYENDRGLERQLIKKDLDKNWQNFLENIQYNNLLDGIIDSYKDEKGYYNL
jgi:hypothetical protein